MKTVTKWAVNPDTGQHYLIDLPGPEVVRQAILELEYPSDGIRVVNATEALAEKFHLSEHQKRAKNRSGLNVFRYDVVAPQFRRLLREGQLEQPDGPKTPYFRTGNKPDQPSLELRETSPQPEWPSVERTAADPKTGEEYQIALPATPVVKQALLDFEYPLSGIHITNIAKALADQFALTEEQSKAKGKYGLVWKRHVNIAANALVNSGQLLRIKVGWIINPDSTLFPVDSITDPEQPDIEPSDSDGDTPSPEVVMAQNYQKHRDRLKDELLQNILDNPPEFFEELVLDLLVKMGYGGSRADAEAVGRSGDGGIDGIINQDKLGLDRIYIQAKRWETGDVGSPDITQFIGALAKIGARKGVLITTSRFSKPAKTAVDQNQNSQIVLIDGEDLVQLMIDHDVGVSAGKFYQLKEVNLDYFAIDDDA